MSNETIMLTPGTLRVSPRVLEASAQAQYNHRSPIVKEAFAKIQANLRKLFELSDAYDLVFFPTTGRGGLEALISSVVTTHKTLIVVNGRWSDYMIKMAKGYADDVTALALPEDKPIDLGLLRAELEKTRPAVVAFTSHETERGLLNPTKEIVELCKEFDSYVVVDAMSSVVVEETVFSNLGVDAFCFNASKGLRSLRDMGIVAIRRSFIDTLKPTNVTLLNLKAEHKCQLSALPKNPFPTSSVLALKEAIDELLEEGLEHRRSVIQENMKLVHEWARERGLEWITEPKYLGWCTLPLRLPAGWDYPTFRAKLLEHGFDVAYSFEGETGKTFEVSTLGYLSKDDVQAFTKAVDQILWP